MDNKDRATTYYLISKFDVFGDKDTYTVDLYTEDEKGYITHKSKDYTKTSAEALKQRIEKAGKQNNIFKEITAEEAKQLDDIIFKQYDEERLTKAADKVVKDFVQERKNDGITAVEKPTLIMLCGQAGAGKSNMAKEYEKRFEGNFVTIDTDDFKLKHPDFADIVKMDGDSWVQKVHEFSSKCSKAVQLELSKSKFNVIIDATLANAEKAEKIMQAYKDNGYNIEIAVTATKPKVSEISVAHRYMKQKVGSQSKYARYVPVDIQKDIITKIPTSLDTLYEKGIADKIVVKERAWDGAEANILFDSSTSKDIKPGEKLKEFYSEPLNTEEHKFMKSTFDTMQENIDKYDKQKTHNSEKDWFADVVKGYLKDKNLFIGADIPTKKEDKFAVCGEDLKGNFRLCFKNKKGENKRITTQMQEGKTPFDSLNELLKQVDKAEIGDNTYKLVVNFELTPEQENMLTKKYDFITKVQQDVEMSEQVDKAAQDKKTMTAEQMQKTPKPVKQKAMTK